ncbi:MAG: hypothetical protein GX781_08865 [Clostridiales bacterium]|nr:hypothetical protein [Clostridiales bacterium]
MNKVLFYAMTGEKSCLMHVLMNAVDLFDKEAEVKVIFEGQSVKLPSVLQQENNPHYVKARDKGLLAGICMACSKQLGVLDINKELGLPLLSEMFGHASMSDYIEKGYQVISM